MDTVFLRIDAVSQNIISPYVYYDMCRCIDIFLHPYEILQKYYTDINFTIRMHCKINGLVYGQISDFPISLSFTFCIVLISKC